MLDVEEERDSEGKEGGEGTQRGLGALEFLTQDVDPSGTTLVDACNGFNKLSRNDVDCAAPLAGRGDVCVQLI